MISISGFGGVMPRQNAALLPDNIAQIASNCRLWNGDLRSLKAPLTVATPTALGGAIKSIYRIGQSLAETQYWMAFTTDVDVARGLISGDTSERTYYTGSGAPRVTNLALASIGGSSYPVNSYLLGIPAPTAAPTCVATATAPIETRSYIYTYVSAWGEEGPPSPAASVPVTEGGNVALSALQTGPAGAYNIATKRIYRSQNTSTGSGIYRLVAEIPVATAAYTDSTAAAALGETLATLYYDPPPASMKGLVTLANGILAAFDGYDVLFCEPFVPYAWPVKYKLATDSEIIGLGAFGASLVVCTKGKPYLISGTHPDSMSMESIDFDQACISKRSIVSTGDGVIYASPDGLVYVGAGGGKILTLQLFSKIEWAALNPATITGRWYDGKYIALFDGGGGFILNSQEEASFTTFDDVVTASYVDKSVDALFVCIGGVIKKFDAGSNKTYTWRSKKFQFFGATCPARCRVDADAYPVTLKLYADGVLLHTETVANEYVFALPVPDKRPREIEFELTGTQPIRFMGAAHSAKELASGR